MRAIGRAICSVVLVMLVQTAAYSQDKSAPTPKPPVVPPTAKPEQGKAHPSDAKAPPPTSEIDKRRERMKQRDGEIDRILKGKQHSER